MKILVTGSNGFLGSEILKVLKTFSVYTLNRHSSDYNLDLSKSIPSFKNSFDLIIHAAGKAHIFPKSESDIASFYDINVKGTKNLLSGLVNSGVPKRFLFVSSVSVYGLISGHSINEENQLLAVDPYGKSKIEAEALVSEWCNKHDVLCTIVRLPLLVGKNPPGNLGSMINGIIKGYYFNIGGGVVKKSMVMASDVSSILVEASKVGGVFNLTDGYHPSFNELSKCIANQINKQYVPNIPIFLAKLLASIGDIIGQRFPFDTHRLSKITSTLTFDDSKARMAFGWKPVSVLEGFKIYEDA